MMLTNEQTMVQYFQLEFGLLTFLKEKFEQKHRVSVERIVSGTGLSNVRILSTSPELYLLFSLITYFIAVEDISRSQITLIYPCAVLLFMFFLQYDLYRPRIIFCLRELFSFSAGVRLFMRPVSP